MIAINDLALTSNDMAAVSGGFINLSFSEKKEESRIETRSASETLLTVVTGPDYFPWFPAVPVPHLPGLPAYPVV